MLLQVMRMVQQRRRSGEHQGGSDDGTSPHSARPLSARPHDDDHNSSMEASFSSSPLLIFMHAAVVQPLCWCSVSMEVDVTSPPCGCCAEEFPVLLRSNSNNSLFRNGLLDHPFSV